MYFLSKNNYVVDEELKKNPTRCKTEIFNYLLRSPGGDKVPTYNMVKTEKSRNFFEQNSEFTNLSQEYYQIFKRNYDNHLTALEYLTTRSGDVER